jgi:hypothetical protein
MLDEEVPFRNGSNRDCSAIRSEWQTKDDIEVFILAKVVALENGQVV